MRWLDGITDSMDMRLSDTVPKDLFTSLWANCEVVWANCAAVTITGPLSHILTSGIKVNTGPQSVSDPITENSTLDLLLQSTYNTNPT